MIVLIAKILAIGAVIAGFWLSAKHWDGSQIVTLIANGILFSILCMIPVGIIVILLQGMISLIGVVAVGGGIGAVVYFLVQKFKK